METYPKTVISMTTMWLMFMLCLSPAATAQDTLTVDEQYAKARQIAFNDGNYEKARSFAYRALEKSPNYHGIRIFVANLYAWEEQYPKARQELQYILEKDPDNRRALLAIVKIESWAGRYPKALDWVDKALTHYPGDEDFMLDKASVQKNMENYKGAKSTYRATIDQHSSQKAREALKAIRQEQMKYSATLSYRHDRFNEIFDPWNFWEFQLGRQTKYGSVIGRVQYANRFSSNGVQFNLDAYPTLFKGLYAYVSGGYSEASIYPDYRFGFSLYKSLPYALELEGGIRYLDFSSSQTTIYTISLSKYLGSYMFTARSYLVPSTTGTSQSLTLLTRRYFGNARTYFSLSGGFGSASADIQFAEDVRRLDSWSIGLSGQYPLSNQFNIGGNAGYDSEEFPNFSRDRLTAKIFLSYRF